MAFLFLAWESVRLHLGASPAKAGATGDQLIDLLVSSFHLFGRVLTLFAGAAKWAILVVALASFFCVAAAVLLFLTARGIQAGRPWARVLGIVLTLVPLVVSLAVVATLHRTLWVILSTIVAALSVYVIWTLALRFN